MEWTVVGVASQTASQTSKTQSLVALLTWRLSIYVDVRSPGSFGGIRNLKRYSGRSEQEVKKFLVGQDTYTLHKPRRIRFPRRKTYSKGIADLYQIDLADVSNLAAFNDGARYLLTCIDVFSKRAWAVAIRTKTGRDVANAFEKIS